MRWFAIVGVVTYFWGASYSWFRIALAVSNIATWTVTSVLAAPLMATVLVPLRDDIRVGGCDHADSDQKR